MFWVLFSVPGHEKFELSVCPNKSPSTIAEVGATINEIIVPDAVLVLEFRAPHCDPYVSRLHLCVDRTIISTRYRIFCLIVFETDFLFFFEYFHHKILEFIKFLRRRRKRRDAEKTADRPTDFNLPNIPHQTPVHNDDPLVSNL